jgi:succinate dehydrogenase / fumarate reductase, membrane anchor subunit
VSELTRFRKLVKVSERHGAGEWLTERVALFALVPLGVWLASTAFTLTGAGYDAVMAWFRSPLNAALMVATVLIFCGYASIAWKVIVEDYIHRPGNKTLLLALVNLVFLVIAAAAVFFIVRLALGSAPLPAGVGA